MASFCPTVCPRFFVWASFIVPFPQQQVKYCRDWIRLAKSPDTLWCLVLFLFLAGFPFSLGIRPLRKGFAALGFCWGTYGSLKCAAYPEFRRGLLVSHLTRLGCKTCKPLLVSGNPQGGSLRGNVKRLAQPCRKRKDQAVSQTTAPLGLVHVHPPKVPWTAGFPNQNQQGVLCMILT